MALIKCSECGQMVSDKAEACPHCGCPVEEPMTCPECGQAVNEGDAYCLKCGCPLGQENNQHAYQYQVTSQVDETWDNDGPSSSGKWLWISLAALALLAIGGTTFWLNQQTSVANTAVEEDTTAVVEETFIEEAPVDSVDAVIDDVEGAAVDASASDSGEWLQGRWRFQGDYEGTYIDVELIIQGDRLIEKWNGKVQYNGTFDYVQDKKFIVYNGGKNIWNVSPESQRIELIDNKYFTKSSGGGSSSGDYGSSSLQNSGEIDEIRDQLESERTVFRGYFEQFRSLMQRYGTSSPDPYLYDNLMGSLNRMIELADKGEKLARQLGKTDEAKWFRSQAQECLNGKNQLIYQH